MKERAYLTTHTHGVNVSPSKPISGVSLIWDFGLGHDDPRGKYYANMGQAEVVETYGRRVLEELECDGIRLFEVETRKHGGTPVDARHRVGPLTFVPVILSIGWDEVRRLHNSSIVTYQGAQYEQLADRIVEGLTDWGRCHVFGHKAPRAKREADSPEAGEQRGWIRVVPFSLNGPHHEDYLTRLDQLGETLGRAMSAYLIERGARR